jgi:hypothetical protein
MNVVVIPTVVTWHYRNPEGGIRNQDASKFNADELNFDARMSEWGHKLVVLDCGIGDHYMFLNILQPLLKKYKHLIIACCYPEVFRGWPQEMALKQGQINIISIASVPAILRDKYNIYKWCIQNNWRGHLIDAYRRMYEV